MTSPRSAPDPRYVFDAEIGQLFFELGGARHTVGDIDLALAWTIDEDGNGCLHKHGKAEQVIERMAPVRAIDPSVQVAILPWEALSHPEAGPEILEEVNACLAISGRVSGFEARIGEIAASYQIDVLPRSRDAGAPGMTL